MPDDIYSWHSSSVTSTPCFSRNLQQLPTTRNSDYGRMYKLKIWKSPLSIIFNVRFLTRLVLRSWIIITIKIRWTIEWREWYGAVREWKFRWYKKQPTKPNECLSPSKGNCRIPHKSFFWPRWDSNPRPPRLQGLMPEEQVTLTAR